MRQKLRPAIAFPPSVILQEELEAINKNPADLPEAVQQVISNNRAIDEDIALQLAQLFNTSSALWLNLERNYQEYLSWKAREQPVQ